MSIAQPSPTGISLDLRSLTRAYAGALRTPVQVVDEIYARLQALRHSGVFTHETSHSHARAAAQAVMRRQAAGERLRLYGIPFAVKDNIDVAGIDTTAACPAFAYRAESSARVVETLLAEGAILIGKTNLDQFATGLVGVRTPYGVAANPFSAEHVPGGSSSGSAVAVARGFVSFALGTDTAGSGRVPAAFNNIVGLKPTRGMLSTHGVVPACRSLDCVSVFALTVDDAALVAQLLAGFDERDPYARRQANRWDPRPLAIAPSFRFALPSREDLVISEVAARSQFEQAVEAAEALGGVSGQLAMAAFTQTAALLYQGAFVAERLEASGELLASDPAALQPVIHEILQGATRFTALDAARAHASLARLRTQCHELLRDFDFLLVPSTSVFPRVTEVLADPLLINTELGRYTNFANLLDLCALAIPAGIRSDGLPFGITLLALAGRDALLASIGKALHEKLASELGATGHPMLPSELPCPLPNDPCRGRIAVVGAHLSGEPLNHELTQLGGRFVLSARTAAKYRLLALATTPPKPGLLRAESPAQGHSIELEVWDLEHAAFAQFVQRIPAPLGVGVIELESGASVQGFLCEAVATQGCPDISEYGGWRAYLRSRR